MDVLLRHKDAPVQLSDQNSNVGAFLAKLRLRRSDWNRFGLLGEGVLFGLLWMIAIEEFLENTLGFFGSWPGNFFGCLKSFFGFLGSLRSWGGEFPEPLLGQPLSDRLDVILEGVGTPHPSEGAFGFRRRSRGVLGVNELKRPLETRICHKRNLEFV